MTSTRERYGWLDRAACLPHGEGWDSSGAYTELLEVCVGCPVRTPCLAAALELGTDGVRGGTTAAERGRRGQHGRRPGWRGLDGYVRMRDGRPAPPPLWPDEPDDLATLNG